MTGSGTSTGRPIRGRRAGEREAARRLATASLSAVPDKTLASTLRAELEVERARLKAQVDRLDVTTETSPGFDDNFADSGQVAAEQGENLALAAQLQEQLDDVGRALAKMDAGTYGLCEVCGREISEARLEAMPATRYCIDHA
jgi:DnaK suppressor protein